MIPHMLRTARLNSYEMLGDVIGLAAICVMIVTALML
ncbi:hypothetical protein SAMN06273572_104125 [Monaibacterium marinum]|uniref:Uncharacterized protein n=1 Tax=Pontivivens marinum TaxID=1690039 RepID=A0A2C9CSU3_9RHOB|nr:hypothetical protein SAMN06273572_104125 [Monaibacterium marinum]